jgi:hypothetical protein
MLGEWGAQLGLLQPEQLHLQDFITLQEIINYLSIPFLKKVLLLGTWSSLMLFLSLLRMLKLSSVFHGSLSLREAVELRAEPKGGSLVLSPAGE